VDDYVDLMYSALCGCMALVIWAEYHSIYTPLCCEGCVHEWIGFMSSQILHNMWVGLTAVALLQ
jgi:hypothetical protein